MFTCHITVGLGSGESRACCLSVEEIEETIADAAKDVRRTQPDQHGHESVAQQNDEADFPTVPVPDQIGRNESDAEDHERPKPTGHGFTFR